MNADAEFWVRTLDLVPHPEGGVFRETYRSAETAGGLPDRFAGPRSIATAIHYLLRAGERSRLHRLRADELWLFHDGGPLHLHLLGPGGHRRIVLGRDAARGEALQGLVPAGCWFGAELAASADFALVSCTCAPGFEYGDFEPGRRAPLLAEFPNERAVIERLTD
ncbi:MAG: cupin domain-containing protein [Candidatus Eisenbacteria bacterium]|nr:cupin domain-containing protein [Candidatus Eisenbacteria bacterium]